MSNDYYEIKSLAEKIGTNRRLLVKKIGWDWSGEWRIVAKDQNEIPCAREHCLRVPSSENLTCLDWSHLLNEARTFFERKMLS